MVPVYIGYMGPEAFGLVGFFSLIQIIFNIMDMGLSSSVSRESARYKAGDLELIEYKELLKSLEVLFVAVAILGGIFIYAYSDLIATSWLNSQALEIEEVILCIKIMAIIIPIRWLGGLYRGIIGGHEKIIWISYFNSIIATARFIGVILVLEYIGIPPSFYFFFQLVVSVIEIVILLTYSNKLLPDNETCKEKSWSFHSIKKIGKFSLTIAFTSFVWILITQLDKLILSGLLSLKNYGFFTLATMVATGVTMLSTPIGSAIMPRMTGLIAEDNQKSMLEVYRNSTQLVALLAGSMAILLAFFSDEFLWVWTGDLNTVQNSSVILTYYAIGNGFMALAAFPFYLQYAKGDLKLHLFGNIAFAAILTPCVIWASFNYGAIGSGYAWMIMNFLFLAGWVPYVHKKLYSGLNSKWYLNDIFPILIPMIFVCFVLDNAYSVRGDRLETLFAMIVIASLTFISGAVGSSYLRSFIKKNRHE